MEQITIDQLHARFKEQGVSAREHIAFKCLNCGTIQSIASLVKAGCPSEDAEKYVGFSCEGRFSNAGPYPGEKNKTDKAKARRKVRGCDWTLGGLFRLHKVEVLNADGKPQPIFEIASADEAQALERLMDWRDANPAVALSSPDRGGK
jgi:hypothetical protein